MNRQATFSGDRSKRFELIREWDGLFGNSQKRKTVNFIMLNPSVADGAQDDPTIRKCVGFAKRWDFCRMVVTNLIPIVSTDPYKLPPWNGIDMENRKFLERWIRNADLIVVAWGCPPSSVWKTTALSEHIYMLRGIAPVPLHCIGMTKHGFPLHPSRTRYTDRPILWNPIQ